MAHCHKNGNKDSTKNNVHNHCMMYFDLSILELCEGVFAHKDNTKGSLSDFSSNFKQI